MDDVLESLVMPFFALVDFALAAPIAAVATASSLAIGVLVLATIA